MSPKKRNLMKRKQIKVNAVTPEEVAQLFKNKGLVNTGDWITFAVTTKLPNTKKDFEDIINALKNEIGRYRQEYYEDSKFKKDCFETVWRIVLTGMSTGSEQFNKLTGKLIPLIGRIIQTNKTLEDIVNVAEKLKQKPKFYMICFYYLILMEGTFKNVLKNLIAMKRLSEGKNVKVTETLGLRIEEEIEKESNLKEILPERLKKGNHRNLRNSIAHGNFRYLDEENKMEFWDINPFTQEYSLAPIKLTYGEFSKPLVEVNFFCEIFGYIILVLIALEGIAKRRI